MRRTLWYVVVVAAAVLAALCGGNAIAAGGDGAAFVTPGVPHPGSDQLFWVPTFAQAEEVAKNTGRMILVMGSVGDWNGY